MPSGGLEGVADVDPYRAQGQVRQRPVPARVAVPELSPQRPAWGRHAVNSGREGSPPA
jgi:hypothetical protein